MWAVMMLYAHKNATSMLQTWRRQLMRQTLLARRQMRYLAWNTPQNKSQRIPTEELILEAKKSSPQIIYHERAGQKTEELHQ